MKTVAIKRFRVYDIEEQTCIAKCDTIEQCVKKLKPFWRTYKKQPSEGGNPYLDFMVDDVYGDIEVNWTDLMGAWDDGERPEDLQMF